MELLSAAFQALKDGLDPIVVIALVLICIVITQLHEGNKLLVKANEKLDGLGNKIDSHGRHQTSRMEEIRKFMINWWERFGPRIEDR